jgi:hypothetical protein
MEDNNDIEILEELISLAQSPRQIEYLTRTNCAIHMDKISAMKQEFEYMQRQRERDKVYDDGFRNGLLVMVDKMIKTIMVFNSNDY